MAVAVLTLHGSPDLVEEQVELHMVQINQLMLALMLLLLVLVEQVVQEHQLQAPVQLVALVIILLLDLPELVFLVNQIMFLPKVAVVEDGEHLRVHHQIPHQPWEVVLVVEHLQDTHLQEQHHNPEQIQHSLITVTLVVIIQMQLDIHLEVAVLELLVKDQLQGH